MSEHLSSTPHVRGGNAYRDPAGFGLQLGALVVDGSLAVALVFLAHRALRLSPVPHWSWVAALAAALGIAWTAQRKLASRTLGERAWRLKAGRPSPTAIALRPVSYATTESAVAGILTLASIALAGWSIDRAVFRQPIWARAETLELSAELPDVGSGRWEVLPFFYALGAWPREYGGQPVFYSLPYEKAPPTRFVGHVIARWDDLHTRVTFEGPKTPQAGSEAAAAAGSDRTPRERIRRCLQQASMSWDCQRIREATLLRHLTEMQRALTGASGGDTALAMKWRLRWFVAKNPAIPPAEQAQGIYLSAQDLDPRARENRGQERYILITENGTHQSISLDYPRPGSPEAETALKTFGQAIRSLRASDDLGPGRAWVDRQLASVRLGELSDKAGSRASPDSGTDLVQKIAAAQALLLGKISVQPSVYDAYFHLGGTAIVLDRIARRGERAGTLSGLGLSAVSKALVQSTYRYAQDIASNDPRTQQLQGFWLESQKP